MFEKRFLFKYLRNFDQSAAKSSGCTFSCYCAHVRSAYLVMVDPRKLGFLMMVPTNRYHRFITMSEKKILARTIGILKES